MKLAILFRKRSGWVAWPAMMHRDVVPTPIQDIAREVSACKMATASPWIWYGPVALAKWLLAHPEANVNSMPPRAVINRARKELQQGEDELTKSLDEVRSMLLALGPVKPLKKKAKKT